MQHDQKFLKDMLTEYKAVKHQADQVAAKMARLVEQHQELQVEHTEKARVASGLRSMLAQTYQLSAEEIDGPAPAAAAHQVPVKPGEPK